LIAADEVEEVAEEEEDEGVERAVVVVVVRTCLGILAVVWWWLVGFGVERGWRGVSVAVSFPSRHGENGVARVWGSVEEEGTAYFVQITHFLSLRVCLWSQDFFLSQM
jgi:hypothetical protein